MIRASCEHVFAHLAQPEHLPRYAAPLWMTADAVEKRGNTHVLALRGYFIGLPVESVQRIVVRQPASVEITQIRGTLRAFSGRLALVSVEDGTEILFRVEADPGIAMISEDAARQFLVQYVERMLDRIKLAAERKAPSRRAARGTATASALPGAALDDEAADGGEAPIAPAGAMGAAAVVTEEPEDAIEEAAAVEPSQPAATGAGPAARPEAASSGRRRRHRRRRRRSRGGTGGSAGPGPARSGGSAR